MAEWLTPTPSTGKGTGTRVFIVRHGQTDWNVRRIYQGHTDVPLNARGAAQAVALGRRLAAAGFTVDSFDAVVCSDLTRCRQTLAGVYEGLAGEGEETSTPAHAVYTPQLRERHMGAVEGLHVDEARPLLAAGTHGETPASLVERVHSAVSTAVKGVNRAGAPANVLVVSHGGAIRAYVGHVAGPDAVGPVGNTSVTLLACDGDGQDDDDDDDDGQDDDGNGSALRLVRYACNAHLEQEEQQPPQSAQDAELV